MPTLDLRRPDVRSEYGLRTETVQEPLWSWQNRQQHRSRADTEVLILEALRTAGRPLTRLDIARAAQRAKTPHFIQILETLVSDGLVARRQTLWRGVVMYLYEVNE